MSLVGPTWVKLLDFFYSGIQFYVLLSPYLCFISFLYIDKYVLLLPLKGRVSFVDPFCHLCFIFVFVLMS